MTDQAIRVLLVDDDPLLCQGLELMLGQAPDIQVVGSVNDGDEVVTGIHQHHPHVILMDVRMQRVGGIEAVAEVRRQPDPPRVLMLTTFDHDDVMVRAVDAGVDGFLLKTSSPVEILAAVRSVAGGESVLSPRSARQLLDRVQQGSMPGRNEARRQLEMLTKRELEVARAVTSGATNAQIAGQLFASEATVKSHLRSAQDKLGLSGRVELAVLVTRAES